MPVVVAGGTHVSDVKNMTLHVGIKYKIIISGVKYHYPSCGGDGTPKITKPHF